MVDYTDDASAVMPEDVTPVRISEITLRPAITVRGADEASVVALVHTAHDECYVANSLATRISIEPTVRTTDG